MFSRCQFFKKMDDGTLIYDDTYVGVVNGLVGGVI